MRLTTKSRLAVTAMIDLTLQSRVGPVPLASIARRQRISISYLEQLFSNLRRNALVTSTRGPGGGYTLGRSAASITVADILIAVDENPELSSTHLSIDVAPDAQQCAAPELWASLNHHLVEFLDSVNLKTLAQEQVDAGVRVEEKAAPMRLAPVPPRRLMPPRNIPNSVFALGSMT
jgi:Rrf2 family iron-sulfur cluster assembly transcriptional regulator